MFMIVLLRIIFFIYLLNFGKFQLLSYFSRWCKELRVRDDPDYVLRLVFFIPKSGSCSGYGTVHAVFRKSDEMTSVLIRDFVKSKTL